MPGILVFGHLCLNTNEWFNWTQFQNLDFHGKKKDFRPWRDYDQVRGAQFKTLAVSNNLHPDVIDISNSLTLRNKGRNMNKKTPRQVTISVSPCVL